MRIYPPCLFLGSRYRDPMSMHTVFVLSDGHHLRISDREAIEGPPDIFRRRLLAEGVTLDMDDEDAKVLADG